jgi:simple sugar transport system ATP-binding protein
MTATATTTPLLELRDVTKRFGSVDALRGVSIELYPGDVHCLLGDNGAGKSTLIKVMSGVHQQSTGELFIDGEQTLFGGPRDAMAQGIATVFQDLAMAPLMSITRNFFLGREPKTGWGPVKRIDTKKANAIAYEEVVKTGVNVRDTAQLVGTLSGGERQAVAIARAVYFGARVLILDEPTSALGVKEAGVVLRYIMQARARGVAVVFITHNVHHAYPVGDRFTILNRGASYGTFRKEDATREEVLGMMAGGDELQELSHELAEFARSDGIAGEDEQELAKALENEAVHAKHGDA